MTNYEKLRRKPSSFRMFTGLTAEAFDELLSNLKPVWLARKAKEAARQQRKRKPGAGRKAKLVLADRLLLTLLDYRVYVTQEFVGFLFGVDTGTVSRKVQEISLCLTGVFRIPERKVRIDHDDLVAVFVDATEQPVNRPRRKQRRQYSGKKKRHTVKHQVVVSRKRKGSGEKQQVRIKAVSKAAKGRERPRSRQEVVRPFQAANPPRGAEGGRQWVSGKRLTSTEGEAEEGVFERRGETLESTIGEGADRGGTRYRQDEDLADRFGAVSQSAASAHGDDEKCRGTPQHHVRVTTYNRKARVRPDPKLLRNESNQHDLVLGRFPVCGCSAKSVRSPELAGSP